MAMFGKSLPPNTLGDAIGFALGGYSRLDQIKKARQSIDASRANAERNMQIEQSITDPRELALFRADPASWAKARASTFEAANVAGGDTRFLPGAPSFTAPKLVGDKGVYGTQTADSFAQTGARGMGVEDVLSQENNQRDYIAKMTPEGFLPRLGQNGEVVGFDADPGYRNFALQKAASGATRVNVPITLPAQNAFAQEFAKQYAQDLGDTRKAAETAQSTLDTLGRAKEMVKGGIYTGMMAKPGMMAGRALAAIGDKARGAKVANTETFQAVMGEQVVNIAKQLGSGSGITNADREFAAKMAGGDIALNEQSISRLMDIQERKARNQIGKFQTKGAEAFGMVPSAQGLPYSSFGMGAAPTASAGVVQYDAQGNRIK